MLVLSTILIDVSNNLPKTSYMKMIDIWLLFSLLLPFTVVLTHTYMVTLRTQEDEKSTKQSKEKNKLFLDKISDTIQYSLRFIVKTPTQPQPNTKMTLHTPPHPPTHTNSMSAISQLVLTRF